MDYTNLSLDKWARLLPNSLSNSSNCLAQSILTVPTLRGEVVLASKVTENYCLQFRIEQGQNFQPKEIFEKILKVLSKSKFLKMNVTQVDF